MEEILLALNVSIADFYCNPQEHLTSVRWGAGHVLFLGRMFFQTMTQTIGCTSQQWNTKFSMSYSNCGKALPLLQPKEILLLGLMGWGHHLGNLGAEGCGFTLLLVTMAAVPVAHSSSQQMGLGLCCSWTKNFINNSPVLHIIIPTELESCFHRETLVLNSNWL